MGDIARAPEPPDPCLAWLSMTKPITAVAVLMLVEEGRLRLYDPVDDWLPELAQRVVMRDPDGSPEEVYPAPRVYQRKWLVNWVKVRAN
jgi:CubicO group peptidase (beta-lactamase class C family)